MKSREVFEHFFPMPAGVRWVESESMIPQYAPAEFTPEAIRASNDQNNRWDGWKTAMLVSGERK